MEQYPATSASLQAMLQALETEFDVKAHGSYVIAKLGSAQQFKMTRTRAPQLLVRSLRYQATARIRERAKCEQESARRVQGQIHNLWYVRAMLAPPTIAMESLASMLNTFALKECKNISKGSVASVRDAGAEIVKHLNREEAKQRLQTFLTVGCDGKAIAVFVMHAHDEACMRMRSYDPLLLHSEGMIVAPGNLKLSRAKGSKIQNHVVRLGIGGEMMPWFEEMRPLLKKDAATTATSIINVVAGILNALLSGDLPHDGKLSIIHLVTGDGVNTNEAAARRVLFYFVAQSPLKHRIRYRIVVWKCGSHKANLIVMVAICGCSMSKPIDGNALCGAAVRLFKYLIPAYCDDFGRKLQLLVLDRVTLVHEALVDAGSRRDACLAALYGDSVVPAALCDLLNLDFQVMVHSCPQVLNSHTCEARCSPTCTRLCYGWKRNR